jgi:acetyltransferase-like isoleucine patch superfamily enzyme
MKEKLSAAFRTLKIARTKLNTHMLKIVLGHLGKHVLIDSSVSFEYPEKISVGDNCEIRKGAILNGRSTENMGIVLDTGVHIHEYAYLDAYGGSIYLGKNVRIGHHSIIAGHGGVVFGNNSGVSGLSYVIASEHVYTDSSKPHVETQTKKGIHIGENVWGASGIIICDGVRIGDNAVIGAGAVVRKDVPENAVVLGNPARVAFYHE